LNSVKETASLQVPSATILLHGICPTIQSGTPHFLFLSILWKLKCLYEGTIAIDSF